MTSVSFESLDNKLNLKLIWFIQFVKNLLLNWKPFCLLDDMYAPMEEKTLYIHLIWRICRHAKMSVHPSVYCRPMTQPVRTMRTTNFHSLSLFICKSRKIATKTLISIACVQILFQHKSHTEPLRYRKWNQSGKFMPRGLGKKLLDKDSFSGTSYVQPFIYTFIQSLVARHA